MEDTRGKPEESPAAKEKIREFCYELALALRRITGKAIEDDLPSLSVSKKDDTLSTENMPEEQNDHS